MRAAAALAVAWAAMAAERLEVLELVQRSMSFLMNRKLSMAWERWQQVQHTNPSILSPHPLPLLQWYADLMNERRLMGGAMARFMKRQMSMAWETWQFWSCP